MQRVLLGITCAAAIVLAPLPAATAADNFIDVFQADLYDGHTGTAEAAASARLLEAPDDAQARFGLGTVQFLEAVEHLIQGLHRYGLRSSYQDWGLGALPLLRLPVPDNPKPEAITYDALRGLLSSFVDGLEQADASLATVQGQVALPLDLSRMQIDATGDGAPGGRESMIAVVAAVTGIGTLERSDVRGLEVNFDASDVLWLRAYCNLLMAIADFPLGYDFRQDFDVTFRGIFPAGDFPPSKIQANEAAIVARLQQLMPVSSPPAYYGPEFDKWVATDEGKRWQEASQLTDKLRYAGVADLIAFIHLAHWPVADAARLKDVLTHLQSMVTLSRESWKSILAETDDDREWIPAPGQHGVLPSMRIDQERVQGWMSLLDQLDGILAGKLLLPHWRFLQGINVRRMLLEPGVFDPVLILQGSGVEPYLEDGPTTDPQVWLRIVQLFEGDLLRYFIWIN